MAYKLWSNIDTSILSFLTYPLRPILSDLPFQTPAGDLIPYR